MKAARMPIYQGCSGVLCHVILFVSDIVYMLYVVVLFVGECCLILLLCWCCMLSCTSIC